MIVHTQAKLLVLNWYLQKMVCLPVFTGSQFWYSRVLPKCVCVNHLNRCKTSTLIGGIAFPYQVLCHEYFTRRLSNLLFICRRARPSVTTLPNEAMSLKGKQLGTPSCVPADSF